MHTIMRNVNLIKTEQTLVNAFFSLLPIVSDKIYYVNFHISGNT